MESNQLKKVLIALDYDPTAKKIAEQGYALAKSLGAEVILLHVITDPVYYSSTDFSPIMGFNDSQGLSTFQFEDVEGLKKASQYFLDKTRHFLNDTAIQTVVREGEIDESILKAAEDLHVDVIVLGTHSRKWLENILIGSVAENVLNHAQIPLFIIPTKKRG